MRLIRAIAFSITLAVLFPSLLSAQGIFGMNKVQYSRLRWSVIETPSVNLHFYPEERELAYFAAQEAESICVEYQRRFNFKPPGRIPLIVYSSHHYMEQTNVIPFLIPEEVGGLTELIRGRVLVPHTGSYYRFIKVLRHELVHAFMLEKLDFVLKKHKTTRYAFPPLWFSEGLAEIWSGPWDSEADMILGDAVLTGRLVPVGELWKISGSLLLYKEGHSFLLFLTEKYGENCILDIMDNWWRKERFEDVIRFVTGSDLSVLNREWVQELRRRYYPLIGDRKSLEEVGERLTSSGTINIRPYCFNQDGESKDEEFVYLSNEKGYSDINERKLSSSSQKSRRLVKSGFSSGFESLHPFRSRLSVNSKEELAFVSKSGGNDVLNILDIKSGKVLKKFEFPSLVSLSSPSWSPDRTKIVFSGATMAGKSDLYLVEIPEGKSTQLTDDPFDDRDPDWSPARDEVVFSSDRGADGKAGCSNLFVLSVASGKILQLTAGPYHDYDPSWNPDGERVCFRSDRDGQFELYVVSRDGSYARATALLSSPFHPDWEPSGNGLLFSGYEGREFHIYRIDLKDSLAWQSGEARPYHQSWTPGYKSTTNYRVRPYRRKFGLDAAQTAVAYDPDFGSGGLGQLALTDVLGNEQLYFLVSSEAMFGGDFFDYFDVGMTYLNLSKRLNYGLGVFRLTRLYDEELDVVRREERAGGLLITSYPFSKFQRLDGTAVLRNVEKHLYRSGKVEDTVLSSLYLSLVRDTGFWTASGISSGLRFYLTLGATRDLKRVDGNSLSLLFDARKYTKLFRGGVVAARVCGRTSVGKEPQRYFLGGSGTLRGFERRALSGTRAFLGNLEIRFPLIDKLIFSLPMGSLEFPTLRGAIFTDWATAGDTALQEPVGSTGVGVFLGSGYLPVIRIDFVRRIYGGRIEPRTYSEFSVGWNF
ncbi:MAG: BamA/TamA family outer membrane protein [Candidatus Eisenbacteria bacterium]|nr:BamA/TamA family outer membrane protein [Candidatus Eisenbacteria bacterium]